MTQCAKILRHKTRISAQQKIAITLAELHLFRLHFHAGTGKRFALSYALETGKIQIWQNQPYSVFGT